MTMLPNLPSVEKLQYGLRLALREEGVNGAGLKVTGRKPNPHSSTFPTEIVTCQLSEDQQIDLFCKYSADKANEAFGHRGGVEYEAKVYDRVLRNLQLPVPRLWGFYEPDDCCDKWLIIEYLANSMKVAWILESTDPQAMIKAAVWIGKFHRTGSERLEDSSLRFLNRYDINYFSGWSERTYQFSVSSNNQSNWLKKVCTQFPVWAEPLMERGQTIIHGEYYPQNILYSEGSIYPVDWESSAISAGEIDIATLTEDWPLPDIKQFEIQYEKTRWEGGTPTDYYHVLAIARIYQHFRWLGDNPDWSSFIIERLEELRRDAEQIGML